MNHVAIFTLTAILYFSCGSVFSAVEMEFVNERIIDGETHKYSVKGSFDGVKAHYAFHTDDNSEVTSGTSIISLDDGETYSIISEGESEYGGVNEKNCHHTTSKEVSDMLGKFLLKITGRFNVKVTNPVVTKVFEKEAEEIHGLKTKHVRMKTTFNANYKFLFFNNKLKVERMLDVWLTPKIVGLDTKPLLQHVWKATGYPQMDEALKEASKSLKGYRLRSSLTQTITDKKGKATETKITTFVKYIKKIKELPNNLFATSGCTKVDSYTMEQNIQHMLFVIAGKPL